MKQLIVLLLLVPQFSQAAKYYVSSSTGSDTNNGTSPSTPWQNLSKIDSTGRPAPGDSIFLKAGDLWNTPLLIGTSGTAAAHIVFSTYSGTARAIISGFYTLGCGTNIGHNIYEFYCPGITSRTNMLVMDGIPQAMGRWPDTGYRTYSALSQSGNTTTLTDASLSSSPYNWVGATLVAHPEFYLIDTGTIIGQTTSTITVDDTFPDQTSRGNGYFIMNDSNTLLLTGIPGRWYSNWKKDSMRVYLPDGPGTHLLEVPVHDTLFYPSNSDSYIDVYNLDFEGSNENTLLINNVGNFSFNNCLFRYGAGNCLLGNNCNNTNFINDTLDYFQNNGARITGNSSIHCLMQNVQINHCGTIPGMGQTQGGTGVASYTGWYNPYGYNTYQNVRILNSGYVGLCFGGDSVNITDCVVDTFCLLKMDGGGFYTTDLSTQTYTYGRYLTHCMALDGQKSPSGTVYDSVDASFGFYCDSHATSVTFTGCTGAYNVSGGMFLHGSKITSYGNNLYGNGYAQRYVAEASGVPITGLSLKKDQMTNSTPGQYTSAFTTLGTAISTFGTVDSNYYGNTVVNAFYIYQSGASSVSFPTWQTTTGFDTHSSFLNVPASFYYNSYSTTMGRLTHLSDLAGNPYFGAVTLSPFSSLILYLANP
jgi:hypothetical protein